MTTYARVVSETVIELFALPEGFTIQQCFNPGIPGAWIECDATPGVAPYWTYDGSAFHPPATEG